MSLLLLLHPRERAARAAEGVDDGRDRIVSLHLSSNEREKNMLMTTTKPPRYRLEWSSLGIRGLFPYLFPPVVVSAA